MPYLTHQQIDFINKNKGLIKQKEIARLLNITPACVNKRIKRGKVVNGYFNVVEYALKVVTI